MRRFPNEWPSRRALLAVAAAVAAVDLAAAATQLRPLLRVGWQQSRQPVRLVRDADLDPLASYTPTAAVAGAAQAIPRGATYALVVGDEPKVADPKLIEIVYAFWLLPRRLTGDPAKADWVIAYHHPSETIGVPYSQEIGVGPSVNVLKVRR